MEVHEGDTYLWPTGIACREQPLRGCISICCDLNDGFDESPIGDYGHTEMPAATDIHPLTGMRASIIERQMHHSV